MSRGRIWKGSAARGPPDSGHTVLAQPKQPRSLMVLTPESLPAAPFGCGELVLGGGRRGEHRGEYPESI